MVVSLIGAMYAPRPDVTASELLRVCRPGGRVVLGNWTPGGFAGRLFRAVAAHVPRPPVPSPMLWGNETVVRERLRAGVSAIAVTPRVHTFRYDLSPVEVVELFARCHGPTVHALSLLDATGRAALRADVLALWGDRNVAVEGGTRVDGEMIEVEAVRA